MQFKANLSKAWPWLHLSVIAASAVVILDPAARHHGVFMIPFCLILIPAYFFLLLRRLKRDGLGHATLNQLHTKVKAGAHLRVTSLEWAAAVALLLASISLASGTHG